MKLNKSYFMGLFITFLMVGIAGIVAGVTIINTNPDNELLHKGRLHTLYLGNSGGVIKVQSGVSYLSVLNGLIVGISVDASDASGSMIGGGYGNNISAQNAGIAGGLGNTIRGNSDYSVIGGGNGNRIWGKNSVVAGGFENEVNDGGIIVGGEANLGNEGGVVLGGHGNDVYGKNSLVMGSGAVSYEGSLVWNDGSAEYSEYAPENSARIDALNGVLIGTGKTVSGVRLVVNGAVKLGSENGNFTGEMSVDGNGCIWASDGVTGHVLGKGSESECTVVTGCLFGSTLLQNGDKVTAYVKPYSTDCTGLEAREIMCNGSELCLSNGTECGHSYDKYYPYCYKISNSDDREYSIKPIIVNSRQPSQGGIGQDARVDDVEPVIGGQQAGSSQNQGQAGYLGPKN